MANESLTFFCPACGIKLTVPVSLAGIVGPCPSCLAQIQAPHSPPAPLAIQAPASMPVTVPTPVVPVHLPSSAAEPPPVQTAASPPPVKPEPSKLPNRPLSPAVVVKQMPEPLGEHPRKPGLSARFLVFFLFLIGSGTLVFEVLTVLRTQTEKADHDQPTLPRPEPPPAANADSEPPAAKPLDPSLPTPPPEQPPHIIDEPARPDGVAPKAPGMDALAALEKFLAAKSLPERLAMIETKTSKGELAMSCLAGPLPAAPKMLLEFQETNAIENVVDFYFSVDFQDGDRSANPQTILVRTRDGSEPKIVADPFLDLLGGRLAAYAANPSDETGVFQVIASALATCTDPKVPDCQKKLTLKLLARENTKEIAEAYFGKRSDIGKMLEDGTYSLSYGKAKACTVVLRWNTEDDVNYPYLEAIAIKTLDWNP